MQYLLSEFEYLKLVDKKNKMLQIENEKLQTLCTKIAENTPVLFWDNKTPEIWGCVLSKIKKANYCDNCIVQSICPSENKGF
jgi:hypothetical protein